MSELAKQKREAIARKERIYGRIHAAPAPPSLAQRVRDLEEENANLSATVEQATARGREAALEEIEDLKVKVVEAYEHGKDVMEARVKEAQAEIIKHRQALTGCKFVLRKHGLEDEFQEQLQVFDKPEKLYTASEITRVVCELAKITATELHSMRRAEDLVYWRLVEAWLLRKYTVMSFTDIGHHQNRDHSTVSTSFRRLTKKYSRVSKDLARAEELLL